MGNIDNTAEKWELLTTAEQVVAAHEAGRRVWNRGASRGCRWHEVGNRGIDNIRAFLRMGWQYRVRAIGATP